MQVGLRRTLSVVVMSAAMVFLIGYGAFQEESIYLCTDKDLNPPEIQKLCQRLTKHQWWGAYYTGKRL